MRLGEPLPGYTGVSKRITASNIFGQTYANSRKSAVQDENDLVTEKAQNF